MFKSRWSLPKNLSMCALVVPLFGGILWGCGEKPLPESENALSGEVNIPNYTETGDLDAILTRKQLRVLIPMFADQARYLPRKGLPLAYEKELIKSYAAELDLVPIWVYVNEYGDLIKRLQAGEGDIISANMTVTETRKQAVDFSLPINVVDEQLVVAADAEIRSLLDMSGRTLAIQSSTSFWDTAQDIIKSHPGIKLVLVDEGVSIQTIVDDVADGKYDATIVDSNLLGAIAAYSDTVKPVMSVAENRAIAWGVRKGSEKLLASLNTFIHHEKLAETRRDRYTDDLDAIKQRKTLRVLTRNNTATYYLWRGELMGFEYEIVKEFARRQGLRLEMIVVPSRDQLETWLLDGRGDLVAASLSIKPLPGKPPPLVFTKRYNNVDEVIVSRAGDKSIKTLDDLKGRKIHVRQTSSYWVSLSKLKQAGVAFDLLAVPEVMETEEIIGKVADGSYDLTVSDSHIVDIEMAWRSDIKPVLKIRQDIGHGWLLRASNPQLLRAANAFIDDAYRGLFYNIAKTKYFKKKRRIAKQVMQRVDRRPAGAKPAALSPYDELVKPLARQNEFDWRLIISQMYQESRFDPRAKSWVGAQGLMQIMPQTAQELGVTQLQNPKNGIRAGILYMQWLRERFEPELSVKDRMWFVLAAYNAGVGHVRDARRLAKQLDLNPNRWFKNVELAMLMLSKPQYAKNARFGYVRGSEPVDYVRSIRDRYRAYLQLTGSS